MICTTLRQSKKLIELGIGVNTADMCYAEDISDLPTLLAYPITDCDNLENKTPAWSLSALLELMPRSINSKKNGQTYLSFHRGYEDNWMIEYSFDDIDRDYLEVKFEQRRSIDAAFQMICWLVENDYIKK